MRETDCDHSGDDGLIRKITLLQTALDASLQGVLITDGDGNVLYHNEYLLGLFGMPDHAMAGRNGAWKEAISRRIKDSERMRRALSQIENQAVTETLDIFELLDGRMVECRTRYQVVEPDGEACRLWWFVDCTEQQRRERELQHLSTHDTLTGMHNRAFFDSRLRQLRFGDYYPICMVMVDIDGLKKVNDRWGHPAGDDMLRQAAAILRKACRTEDVVARLGGDEFGMLLIRAGADTAEQVTNRIIGLINLHNIRHPKDALSLSLGYAVAKDKEEIEDLFDRADRIMYEARRKRRAKVLA